MAATGSAYVATGAVRLLQVAFRRRLRLSHRGKGQGELAAHEGDLAFDHDHTVGQSADVGLEPGEQSDLQASERQRGGDNRGFGIQGGVLPSGELCVA